MSILLLPAPQFLGCSEIKERGEESLFLKIYALLSNIFLSGATYDLDPGYNPGVITAAFKQIAWITPDNKKIQMRQLHISRKWWDENGDAKTTDISLKPSSFSILREVLGITKHLVF